MFQICKQIVPQDEYELIGNFTYLSRKATSDASYDVEEYTFVLRCAGALNQSRQFND